MKILRLLLIAITICVATASSAQSWDEEVISEWQNYEQDSITGITCENLWIIDRVHTPETFLSLPFVRDYATLARTAVIDKSREKIYLGYSKRNYNGGSSIDYAHLVILDLKTGAYERELALTCNETPISGLLCANQVGIDDAGNVWICGMYSDVCATPAKIYVVEDFETGACRNVGEWKLPDEETTNVGRIDYWDVVGDITGETSNAVCMAAVGKTATGDKLCLYRWELAQGATEWKANKTWKTVSNYINKTYPADQVTWGQSATTVRIVAEEGHKGSLFYVDGFTTYPSLYNTSFEMVGSFASAPDLAPAVGCNGVNEFTLNGKSYLAYVEAQYNVYPGCRVNICELGEGGSFEGMRKLWSVPEAGLGEMSDGGNRIHSIDTYKVVDENGREGVYLLTYKCYNGIGLYLIAEKGFSNEFHPITNKTIEIDGVVYQLNTTTKNTKIIKTTESLPNTLVIPSHINYKEDSYIVTEIPQNTFYGCTRLTSVTIPNSITTIGDYSFCMCTNLANIYSLNTTPPSCSATTFSDYTATLYIPQNSYAKYFIDEVWGKFDNLKKIEALVSSITLDKTALDIIQGETYQLSATIEPENAIISTVEWESSNPKIAIVDNHGKVTGVSKGTTVITAKAIDGSNVSASCIVGVDVIPAQSIKLSQTETSVIAGNLLNLECTVLPQNTANKSVTWTSSDDRIALIIAYSNGSATIKGISAGSATIFAVTNDGSNLTAMCKVTVKSGKAETITLSQTEAKLPVNDIMTLSYTILPTDAVNKTATWATSDKSIAAFKVNNDGSITIVGVSEGIAIITATTNDGSNLSASCIIRVTNISGIDSIVSNCSVTEVARYDIYGRLLSKPTLGINIVKYSDGTTRKECVK